MLERVRQSKLAVSEYCYTDLSHAFLMHAQDRFGAQHRYLSCRLLDIEKDPLGQGFGVGEFDVVVAANVLHATRDIRTAVNHAKRLLRRGGLLVLNELSTAGSVFAHLTFGLTEGWWRFEDAPLRFAGSPALAHKAGGACCRAKGSCRSTSPRRPTMRPGNRLSLRSAMARCGWSGRWRRKTSRRLRVRPVSCRGVRWVIALRSRRAPRRGAAGHVTQQIISALAESMRLERGVTVETDRAFADYGVDSILGVSLIARLNRALSLKLPTTSLFEHRSVAGLAAHILAEYGAQLAPAWSAVRRGGRCGWRCGRVVHSAPRGSSTLVQQPLSTAASAAHGGIAVVGMSSGFSQSTDRARSGAIWPRAMMVVSPMSAGICRPRSEVAGVRGAAGRDYDLFDPGFFNISGREAQYMDLQQRFVLMECWRALEDAGYSGDAVQGRRCGVCVGCSNSDYAEQFGVGAEASLRRRCGATAPR